MSVPPSMPDRRLETFPVLTGAQIERIRPLGYVRRVQPGEILFEPGDRAVPLFVLLSGKMEIIQPTFEGERPVVQHGAGEFTGEIATLSGQDSLVRGRVLEGGEFLQVNEEGLRSLIAKDAELSEILLRAFILRRDRTDPPRLGKRGCGGIAALGKDSADPRVSQPQRASLCLSRFGPRPAVTGIAGPLRDTALPGARGDLLR